MEYTNAIAAQQMLKNLHLYLSELLRTQEHPLLGKDEITTILLLTDLPDEKGDHADGT